MRQDPPRDGGRLEIIDASFGGPEMKTLFVTAGKTLYKLRTDIPGLPR